MRMAVLTINGFACYLIILASRIFIIQLKILSIIDNIWVCSKMLENGEGKDDIYRIFKSLIEPREYKGKPIPLNRFSIGSLSFDVEKEIQRKLGLVEETTKDRLNMFRGTALHNYIQEMVKTYGFEAEQRLYLTIPFQWEYMGFSDITLVGVIDLLHRGRKEMVELKSSTSSDKIEDYHKMQLASYMKMYSEKYGEKFHGTVVKFGGSDVIAEEVGWDQVEGYWSEIIKRSIYCAKKLDRIMSEKDTPEEGGKDGLYSF